MKAIVTKRHGNYRIRATAEGVAACIIDRPDNATQEEEHGAAARELCRRMGWPGYLVGGGLPDGQSYAWAFLPDTHPAFLALFTLSQHARETYPHFESERGTQDIAAAETVLRGRRQIAPDAPEGVAP